MPSSGTPLATHPSAALDVDLVVGVALDAAQAVLGARACAYVALERSTAALADRATSDAFLPAARRAALEGAGAVFGTGRDGEPALRCHRVAVLGEPRGVLVVEHAADRLPGRVADAQASALADSLGVMIARVLRSRPTQHAYDALSQIAAELHSPSQEGDAVLSLIVHKARELVDTDVAWMELVVDGELVPVVVRGARDEALLTARAGLEAGIGATALAEQRALVVADCRAPSVPGGVREALVAEGLVSLICAPMLGREEESVGVLYVADRHRTPFADSDARLLSALAAQASIALANRTLYARLREHNELLEETFSVHHELTQASLTGVGVQGVVELLALLVGHPIALTVDSGDVPVVRSGDAARALGDDGLHAAVTAGSERLGVLQVIGASTLAPLQRKAFEHGQTVLALELLRERAAREVEWRLSGELLDGLLECEGEPPAALSRRAEYLRVDLTQPHRVLAFGLADEVDADRLLAQVRGLLARRAPGNAMHALSGRRGCWVVVALPPALEGEAAGLAAAVRGLDGERWQGVRVGIGPLNQQLTASWRAATACVAFAERIGGSAGVTDYDELGPLRFVLDTPDPGHAVAIASEALEQLIEHDRRGRSELLGTLRAYLETGGHQRETADRCHIATSTLKYRLAKIRDVLGRNPADPDTQFELMLAFKLRDLLAATGAEAQDARVPADSAD